MNSQIRHLLRNVKKAIRENRMEIRIFTCFKPSKFSKKPEVEKQPMLGFNSLVLQNVVGE